MHDYTKKELMALITGKLRRNFGRDVEEATAPHMFKACALVLRDIMSERQMATEDQVAEKHQRQVHYLSLEFLMGRSLMKNAYNLGVLKPLTEAIEALGFSAPDLFEAEPDAGLGNGGLGRLAACYLDSMTTLDIPATGYSICYELGTVSYTHLPRQAGARQRHQDHDAAADHGGSGLRPVKAGGHGNRLRPRRLHGRLPGLFKGRGADVGERHAQGLSLIHIFPNLK